MKWIILAGKVGRSGLRIVDENLEFPDQDRAYDLFGHHVEFNVVDDEELFLGMYEVIAGEQPGEKRRRVAFVCSSKSGPISGIEDLPPWLLPDGMLDDLLKDGSFDS